jgi:hypothetical protein
MGPEVNKHAEEVHVELKMEGNKAELTIMPDNVPLAVGAGRWAKSWPGHVPLEPI